ncbi:MAG: AAA family ATPase [Desulfobacteraceae bacterium]|jgi:endopeptidase Clp ATP-binding regulatory subunit ClpX
MKEYDEKIPNPKEIEKELGEFLAKKFGGSVKLASPVAVPQQEMSDTVEPSVGQNTKINFDLKPEELISYLDQYLIKQEAAKAILATKICTHFNRIRYLQSSTDEIGDLVGSIKNNILMLGPTGVGKTYMIRLIAHKIGVPFVKGDATKFSETGYVGGDVEDLVRDLVREADGDVDRAQYGIIYIDEIDKIASSHNLVGADVSRTGVQRALLKPMEETEVDLKVPHDPISMLQEIERFRKTGERDNSTVNTKNILFIMSGAFTGLDKIIQKRLTQKAIGFGASFSTIKDEAKILGQVKSEDLIEIGFESEFVGRLPVRAVLERLTEEDLFAILMNPNNPIILGKKLDFASYGIDIKFDDEALRLMAHHAYDENTGARGLVSAVEQALLEFEKRLPSTRVRRLPVTVDLLKEPEKWLTKLESSPDTPAIRKTYENVCEKEISWVADYISSNRRHLSDKHGLPLTKDRIDLIAKYYSDHAIDIECILSKLAHLYEQTKTIEMNFLKNNGINIVLEDETIDYIISQWLEHPVDLDAVYKKLSEDFLLGLKLVHEKTGNNRFFITRQAIENPENFVAQLLKHGKTGS